MEVTRQSHKAIRDHTTKVQNDGNDLETSTRDQKIFILIVQNFASRDLSGILKLCIQHLTRARSPTATK